MIWIFFHFLQCQLVVDTGWGPTAVHLTWARHVCNDGIKGSWKISLQGCARGFTHICTIMTNSGQPEAMLFPHAPTVPRVVLWTNMRMIVTLLMVFQNVIKSLLQYVMADW